MIVTVASVLGDVGGGDRVAEVGAGLDQRRAQLVRGVGDEPSLRVERRPQPGCTYASARRPAYLAARNSGPRPVIRMSLVSIGLGEVTRNGQPACSA